MKKTLIVVLTLTFSLLNGCGFKLKGQYDLAPELSQIELKSEKKFSPLAKQLGIQLSRNGVKLVKGQANTAQIKLFPEAFQRRTLSLFPNGQVAEYELIYQVYYQVILPGEKTLDFEVSLSREFQDDPNNSLAKDRERLMILTELRQIASDRILSQLLTVQP